MPPASCRLREPGNASNAHVAGLCAAGDGETQETGGVLPITQPDTPLGNGPGFATATDPQTIAVTSPGPFASLRPSTAHTASHLWYSEHWSKEVW